MIVLTACRLTELICDHSTGFASTAAGELENYRKYFLEAVCTSSNNAIQQTKQASHAMRRLPLQTLTTRPPALMAKE
jgi:hypothetical protein